MDVTRILPEDYFAPALPMRDLTAVFEAAAQFRKGLELNASLPTDLSEQNLMQAVSLGIPYHQYRCVPVEGLMRCGTVPSGRRAGLLKSMVINTWTLSSCSNGSKGKLPDETLEMLQRVQDAKSPWDLLVIGGGATGLGIA